MPDSPTVAVAAAARGGASRWRRHARLVDGAVAGGLAAAGLVLLATYRGRAGIDDAVPYADADVVGVLLVLAVSVPLWWRRTHPVMATAAVAGAALLLGMLTYAAPLAGLALLLGAYACGAYASFRTGVVGTLAAAVSATAYLLVLGQRYPDLTGTDPGGVLVNLLALGGAWALGRGVRNRRLYTDELVDRAQRLERTRAAEVRAALAEERGRIVRELHDVVAHHVSVMTVQAAAARRTVGRDPGRSAEAMESVEATGRAALVEMRRIVDVLRGPDRGPESGHEGDVRRTAGRSPQPGLADLDQLVAQVREAGLDVEVVTEGTPVDLPAGVELTAYRVVQEALTNTLKHAGPARARVSLRHGPDGLDLRVSDSGHGLAAGLGERPTGHGLLGMRERVALYGGSLHVGPRDGGGFEVRVRIPVGSSSGPSAGGQLDTAGLLP